MLTAVILYIKKSLISEFDPNSSCCPKVLYESRSTAVKVRLIPLVQLRSSPGASFKEYQHGSEPRLWDGQVISTLTLDAVANPRNVHVTIPFPGGESVCDPWMLSLRDLVVKAVARLFFKSYQHEL
jgi:hypothetical protein